MKKFEIIDKPSSEKLKELDVNSWPKWRKDKSEFVKIFEVPETCYILEGEAEITPEDGESVVIKKGMLVYFPAECTCRWHIKSKLSMKYLLG